MCFNRLSIAIISAAMIFSSCSDSNNKSDAYGTFESEEISISSEATGRIIKLNIDEGQVLPADTIIGLIDTTDLVLKKEQLNAQKEAISSQVQNIISQINVQKQQKENLLVEKKRVQKLLKDNAATTKQLDDINGAIDIIDKQIISLETQNSPVLNNIKGYEKQIDQIKESIKKCYIKNPIKATILTKYAQPNEFAIIGKALFKIADLSKMYLRIYVSGTQLANIKIGQKAEVLIDKNEKENRSLSGVISWVSQNAEFTPKIIQTKEERVNLVYAVKILVINDGTLKIGMPGEANFNK
jgi:HlyD family secretion protein